MPQGKAWPKGKAPWDIVEGGPVPEPTLKSKVKAEAARGNWTGPAHRAFRQAHEDLGVTVPAKYLPPVEAVEAAPEAPAIELESAPAPAAVEPMVERQAPPVEAVEERAVEERTAPSRAGSSARSATVGVSYRATVAQHDKLRDLAHVERTSIQALLDEAVNDFLAKRRG